MKPKIFYYISKGCYVGYNAILTAIWVTLTFYIIWNVMPLKDAYLLSKIKTLTLWLGLIGTIGHNWIGYSK